LIEVYREKDPVFIPALQNHLESAGIPTFIRNENLSAVEVNIPVFFQALCIVNEKDLTKAQEIILPLLESFKNNTQASTDDREIICDNCGEKNPSNFDGCWNCQHPLKK